MTYERGKDEFWPRILKRDVRRMAKEERERMRREEAAMTEAERRYDLPSGPYNEEDV
jgi:hypothetical protein